MRKKVSILVCILLLTMIFTGCSGSAQPAASSAATSSAANSAAPAAASEAEKLSGNVTIWTFLDPAAGKDARSQTFAKIIANFEAKNPDVTVKVEPQQFDLLTQKFLASAQAGMASDIIWILHTDVPLIVNSGTLAALEDTALKDWKPEEIEDIRSGVFDEYAKDGKHYVKDIGVGAYMIYFRKDLLDAKGIKYPFESWEELIEAAKQFNGVDPKTGVEMYGLGIPLIPTGVDPTIIHSVLAAEMDNQIFNPDGTAGWNGEKGLEALQFTKKLIYEDKIVPEAALSTQNDPLIQQFIAGKFAMVSAASLRMAQIRGAVKICDPLDIQIMPYPKYKGKTTPHNLSGWTFGINKYSKNIGAASAFYAYMISPEADEIWCKEALQNPSRKSTITNHQEYFNKPENQFFMLANKAISETAFVTVNPKGYSITGWTTDITKSVEDSVTGGMSDQQALDASVAAFNKRNIK